VQTAKRKGIEMEWWETTGLGELSFVAACCRHLGGEEGEYGLDHVLSPVKLMAEKEKLGQSGLTAKEIASTKSARQRAPSSTRTPLSAHT
jgi:hypothetical protein